MSSTTALKRDSPYLDRTLRLHCWKMHALLIIFLAAFGVVSHGADILMFEPMPTMSHYHLFDKLAVELTKRGHQVTLLAPFKQSRAVPNLTEVELANVYKEIMASLTGSKSHDILKTQVSPWKTLLFLPKLGQTMSSKLLDTPTLKKFLEKDQKFDVLIAENFLVEAASAGLAFKYGLPIVAVVPFIPAYWSNYMVGNPAPTSFVPDPILGYTGKMNFYQRLSNTLYYLVQMLNIHVSHLPAQDSILKKYFGPETPRTVDILRNTSLVLVNHYHSLGDPRPYLPNVIEVGGYHVVPPGQLPPDLKRIMDESPSGVILFSMGSHLKSREIPEKMIKDIIKVFSRLKQTILWKYEDDTLGNLPGNVIIRKWLPQSDILAHPNLKLFITHGGLLSTFEALYRGVPLVGIPVMGDQPINMRYASEAGYAVVIPISELNHDNLYAAVTEVLNNPKYAESARRGADVLRDRPMKPMDAAVYWIEYVIRHRGAPHLRSPAQDLTWYQIHLLDVFAVLIAVALSLSAAIFILCKTLFATLTGNKRIKRESSSKKKD